MQISNVISGLTDAASWGKKGESALPTGTSTIKPADSQTQISLKAQKASVEILRQYNIADITPTSFSRMIQQLHQAGAISEKDFQELSAVRADLEKAGIEGDEAVNLLEFYTNKVSQTAKSSDGVNPAPSDVQLQGSDSKRLDWMKKFAAIQADPDAAGLDLAG